MSQQPKPYPLRMSEEMREQLQAHAEAGGRSLNAEIVRRLQQSLNERVVHEATFDAKVPSPKAVIVGDAYKKMVEDFTNEVVTHLISSPRFKIIPLDPSKPSDDEYVEEDQPKP